MNGLEFWLSSFGLSWQLVKLLPFIVLTLFGLFIGWKLTARVRKKGVRILMVICCSQVFALAYFLYSPIYQGDFSLPQNIVEPVGEVKKMKENELIVCSIPGCPHCYESIHLSNQLLKRNPKMRITYLILAEDLKSVSNYKKRADKRIHFKLAKDEFEMEKFVRYAFPTYIFKRDGKVYRWSGNELGPKTLDFIEDI